MHEPCKTLDSIFTHHLEVQQQLHVILARLWREDAEDLGQVLQHADLDLVQVAQESVERGEQRRLRESNFSLMGSTLSGGWRKATV